MKQRVAIIGSGLQGRRHALSLQGLPDVELVLVADANDTAAEKLASEMGCDHADRWQMAVEREDVDIVTVCTPPDSHAEISIGALSVGKHVLCEKPLARTVEEAAAMVAAAEKSGAKLKCGFNLRHHPAIQAVRRWVDEGRIGNLSFVRCRYGIGGREGYADDWRTDPEVSGGGELMDQGIHALDLCRWFFPNIQEVTGFLSTTFWPIAPTEDNAFVLLRGTGGRTASIHVSWTQWKPVFSFEAFGENGYAIAEGLGGAYGTERATLGLRDFTAPFSEETTEFRGQDVSWKDQWVEFLTALDQGREPMANGSDGLEALKLAHAARTANATGAVVTVS